jgi:nucleoside-diphosphate-sugar epimerase
MILITGSAGFVGRAFLRSPYLYGDLRCVDIETGRDARDFFREDETQYDLVIHLAAVVGGRKVIEGSPLSLAVDLSIDAEMASWALRTKPKHILYFSSSAAYPVQYQTGVLRHHLQEDDIDLTDIKTPDLLYGWAKLTGELLMNNLRREGLSITTIRPFSGYGSDQSLDYPFPALIQRALQLQDPFVVWGSDRTVRDWVHIEDVVRISMAFARVRANHAVNICTGIGTSFRKLVEIISEQVGFRPEIIADISQPRGVAYRVGNPNLMLNYEYPRINVANGVALALSESHIR